MGSYDLWKVTQLFPWFDSIKHKVWQALFSDLIGNCVILQGDLLKAIYVYQVCDNTSNDLNIFRINNLN